MNAPFAPVDLNAGYADVSALLKILADPVAHKARLDELVGQEKSTREQIAALNAMAADTRRLHSAAEATNIVSTNRKAALDAREAELDTRAAALEMTEATRSHQSLQRREAACLTRENVVAQAEKRLAKDRADLAGKSASIKGLADTLHH
jgi:hypothetical protein